MDKMLTNSEINNEYILNWIFNLEVQLNKIGFNIPISREIINKFKKEKKARKIISIFSLFIN